MQKNSIIRQYPNFKWDRVPPGQWVDPKTDVLSSSLLLLLHALSMHHVEKRIAWMRICAQFFLFSVKKLDQTKAAI
jgi:hypothetical protein